MLRMLVTLAAYSSASTMAVSPAKQSTSPALSSIPVLRLEQVQLTVIAAEVTAMVP